MKLKDRLGKHPVLIITTICVICVAVIAGFTAHIELQRYEDGILDVCATQQDAYVQLVLDQINLSVQSVLFPLCLLSYWLLPVPL